MPLAVVADGELGRSLKSNRPVDLGSDTRLSVAGKSVTSCTGID